MRMYRYAYRLFDILISVASAIAAFALAIVRTSYATSWHSLRTLKVAAFTVIADLKPVYRESYDTHGLSLDHRWRCQGGALIHTNSPRKPCTAGPPGRCLEAWKSPDVHFCFLIRGRRNQHPRSQGHECNRIRKAPRFVNRTFAPLDHCCYMRKATMDGR